MVLINSEWYFRLTVNVLGSRILLCKSFRVMGVHFTCNKVPCKMYSRLHGTNVLCLDVLPDRGPYGQELAALPQSDRISSSSPSCSWAQVAAYVFWYPWTNNNVRKHQLWGQNISKSHLLHFNFIISQEKFSNPVIACNQAPVVFSESLLQCWVTWRYWEQLKHSSLAKSSNFKQWATYMWDGIGFCWGGFDCEHLWIQRPLGYFSNLEVAETAHKLVEWVLKEVLSLRLMRRRSRQQVLDFHQKLHSTEIDKQLNLQVFE